MSNVCSETPTGTPAFAIPSAELKSAIESNKRGNPTFWSHQMYRDDANNRVKVHYSNNKTKSEEIARIFLDEPILGFGMQWLVPGDSIVEHGEPAVGLDDKNNIALIVLASEKDIGIFHLALHHGSSGEQIVAPTLKKILESEKILKAGVLTFSLKSNRLAWRFGVQLRGIFELPHLHNLLNHTDNQSPKAKVSKSYIPINDLVELHLQLPLFRGRQIRLSNWGRRQLREAQTVYAANDAYAGYQLFRVMDTKRRKLQPTPPLPNAAEKQTPIQRAEFFRPSVFNSPPKTPNKANKQPQQPQTLDPSVQPSLRQAEEHTEEESPTKKRKTDAHQHEQSAELNNEDEKVFMALKQARRDLAEEQGIGKYFMIAHDSLLRRLAKERPADLESLSKFSGIGPKKLENYGKRFLETIAKHSYDATPANLEAPETQRALEASQEQSLPVKPPNATPSATLLGETALRDKNVNPPNPLGFSPTTSAALNNTSNLQSQDRLFSTLSLIRIFLTESTGQSHHNVASDELLRTIASSFSSENANEALTRLESIDGWTAFSEIASSCGLDLYKFLTKHSSSASSLSGRANHRPRADVAEIINLTGE